MRWFACSLLWAVVALDLLPAADVDQLPVVAIEFSPATQPLASEHLDRLILVEKGVPLDRRKLSQSLDNLFRTGRYADIQVDRQAVGDGITLTFLTKPSWFMGQVQVIGVPAPPTPIRLVNATQLKLGELYWQDDINFAKHQIRQLLADNGFESPQVTEREILHDETQQVDIVLEVTPGPRAGIGEIVISSQPASVLSEAKVRRIAKWRLGKPFTQRAIQRGLERLKGHFRQQEYWQADVRADWPYYNPDENQRDLVLSIERGPRVQVRVEGFEFSRRQLRRYIPVFEEGVVDEDLLAEGASNLRDYLQTKGYFAAEVEPLLEQRDQEQVEIVYRVEPGPRRRLVHVGILGNRYFDTATIEERLLTQEKSFDLRRGRFSQGLLERDRQAIRALYLSNGFRDVLVEARAEEGFQGRPENLAVFFTIEEGPQTLVEELTIKGAEKIPPEDFEFMLASVGGQPFSEASVATDRSLILARYFNEGYRDAELAWRFLPGSNENRVAVEYEINEGGSLYVDKPIVSGLEYTQESLVREQLRISEGAPLSQSSLFETQRRLYDLGIFSEVDVGLQNPNGVEPSKNVLFQVEEARRWTLGIGGGAEFARIGGNTSDITSPLGDNSFSPRATIEVTRLNVRGIGHTLSMRTRFSSLQQRALVTYEAPRWTGSEKWNMTISGLWDTSRNVRTFTGRRLEGALQFRHQLSKPSTALYRFIYRRTTIDEQTLNIDPLLVPLTSQPVRVGLLSGTYIQDRRDDPTDSTRGIYNTADLGFASGVWGSEPDFFRFLGQNSTYHRLTPRIIIARTLQLGILVPTSRFGNAPGITDPSGFPSAPDPSIPLSERFFSGGANSHRGFPFNQAGPRDPTTGFPIGGGAQLLNSVELRFPLPWQNIGGVLFHDAGNVYSRPGQISLGTQQDAVICPPGTPDQCEPGEIIGYDFDYMVHAVGLGLRYRTPIGPVRLDFGYSLNPPRFIGLVEAPDGSLVPSPDRISHFNFHFSLGQTF